MVGRLDDEGVRSAPRARYVFRTVAIWAGSTVTLMGAHFLAERLRA